MNPETQARIDAAQQRIIKAQAELEAAGEELLQAIGATDEEVSGAADALADVHHETDADGWAGAEWRQMVANQVLYEREADTEQEQEPVRGIMPYSKLPIK